MGNNLGMRSEREIETSIARDEGHPYFMWVDGWCIRAGESGTRVPELLLQVCEPLFERLNIHRRFSCLGLVSWVMEVAMIVHFVKAMRNATRNENSNVDW